jgi:hypothetical protein
MEMGIAGHDAVTRSRRKAYTTFRSRLKEVRRLVSFTQAWSPSPSTSHSPSFPSPNLESVGLIS